LTADSDAPASDGRRLPRRIPNRFCFFKADFFILSFPGRVNAPLTRRGAMRYNEKNEKHEGDEWDEAVAG
jgi:hypothetical protein